MTWVAWRQYRSELLIGLGILALLMAWLVPTGLDKHALFGDLGIASCSESSRACMELRGQLGRSYDSARNIVTWFNFAPALVAVVLAAPIVSEFEQRTHRLAWTQSITRGRWLTARLAISFGAATVFAVALTALMTWWFAPFDRIDLVAGSDLGRSFDFEGVMPFAYTIFALCLALASGVFTRRMLVSIPMTFVGFIVLRVLFLELHRQGVTGIDYDVDDSLSTRDMARFWTYQAVEGAFYLAASAVLMASTIWAVKRRAG